LLPGTYTVTAGAPAGLDPATPPTSGGIVVGSGLASLGHDFGLMAIPAAPPVAPTASGPALPATRPPPLRPPPLAKPSGGQVPKALLQLRRRSYKLWPVAGAGLATRRPVLHWARGPKGTVAYNIQIWQYPGLKRVLSAYPSGTTLKVRAGVLEAGRRYVWRGRPHNRGGPHRPAPPGGGLFPNVPQAGRWPPAPTGDP